MVDFMGEGVVFGCVVLVYGGECCVGGGVDV